MVREGYKQTEIGLIPEDWAIKQISEIADIDPENLTATTHAEYEFKYISLEDVDRGVLKGYSNQVFCTAPSRARRVLRDGDVILSTVRPNLKSHLLFNKQEDNWICSTGFSVLRCKKGLSIPEFLFSHLFSGNIDSQIETLIAGSNYPAINSSDVRRLKIAVSTVEEQRSLAQALSDVDALIAALDKLIAKKRDLKTATMQQLLTGKKRLPGFGEGKGYKESAIGLIPEDWEVNAVGNICDFIVPGRNKPKTFKGNIPWVTTPDLEDGRSVFTSKLGLFISRDEAKLVGSKVVPSGAVIMSCVGELGIVAFVEREIVINQQLHAFIPSPIIDSLFLLNALQAQKDFMFSIATQTAVPYLNKDNCNSIPIPLPSILEQRAIATVLSDMDKAIASLESRLAKTQAIKQGMMQELLTGRTRLI